MSLFWLGPPIMIPFKKKKEGNMTNPEFKTTQGKEAYERLMQTAEQNKQHMIDYQSSEDVAERIHILSMYFTLSLLRTR